MNFTLQKYCDVQNGGLPAENAARSLSFVVVVEKLAVFRPTGRIVILLFLHSFFFFIFSFRSCFVDLRTDRPTNRQQHDRQQSPPSVDSLRVIDSSHIFADRVSPISYSFMNFYSFTLVYRAHFNRLFFVYFQVLNYGF